MRSYLKWLALNWRYIMVILAPILWLPVPIIGHSEEFRCAYVILIMATYWVSEAVPLAITAMIPVFAFPLLGILSTKDITVVYLKDTNFMFMGGLIMAVAVEHCNLHKRIALSTILYIGQSPSRLLAGFMLTTCFLSMWISNTAAAAMLVPIVHAVANQLDKTINFKDPMKKKKEAKEKAIREAASHSKQSQMSQSNTQSSFENAAFSGEDSSSLQDELGSRDMTSSPKPCEDDVPEDNHSKSMRKMLFLGVAFGANIGGTGSPLGCGPNLVVFALLQSTFGEGTGLNFASWMMFNIPGMLVCLFLGWLWLRFLFKACAICRDLKHPKDSPSQEEAIKTFLKDQYNALGRITQHELVVLISFTVLVFLWVFRAPGFINGWAYYISNIFEEPVLIRDATPVMFMVFLLFSIPKTFKSGSNLARKQKPEACLTWKVVQEKTPWGVILLLGGGLAMAEGAKVSGLSNWLGEQLSHVEVMPKEAIVFTICLMTAMLTEVASNTATASVLLPVIRDLALHINVNPLYLMLPATVCCAYAFMLPVATPGNALILSSAGLKTHEMIRAGLMMNVVCVLVISFMINTLGVLMFDLHNFPDWAVNVTTTAVGGI